MSPNGTCSLCKGRGLYPFCQGCGRSQLESGEDPRDVVPTNTSCWHCDRDVSENDEVLHVCPSCDDQVCIDCWAVYACSNCDDRDDVE